MNLLTRAVLALEMERAAHLATKKDFIAHLWKTYMVGELRRVSSLPHDRQHQVVRRWGL